MSQNTIVTSADGPRRRAGGRTAGPGSAWPLLVIATAQLMWWLDATIVNVALPTSSGGWGFPALAWSGWSPPTRWRSGAAAARRRAGDLLGRRKVFIAGLLLFSAASLAAGSHLSAWLLAARAFPGSRCRDIAATALA